MSASGTGEVGTCGLVVTANGLCRSVWMRILIWRLFLYRTLKRHSHVGKAVGRCPGASCPAHMPGVKTLHKIRTGTDGYGIATSHSGAAESRHPSGPHSFAVRSSGSCSPASGAAARVSGTRTVASGALWSRNGTHRRQTRRRIGEGFSTAEAAEGHGGRHEIRATGYEICPLRPHNGRRVKHRRLPLRDRNLTAYDRNPATSSSMWMCSRVVCAGVRPRRS